VKSHLLFSAQTGKASRREKEWTNDKNSVLEYWKNGASGGLPQSLSPQRPPHIRDSLKIAAVDRPGRPI
jgi:hypothetical protein